MMKVGIIGGAGYTAGELIRLLVNHPGAEIVWVHSTSNAGNRIDCLHSGLTGDTDMVFCGGKPPLDEADVVFICSAHGESARFMDTHATGSELRIIDLSQDFRDESNGFIYGLPELNAPRIAAARRIANPGCFATAIQLALLPAVAAGAVEGEVNVTAVTGSTGAGVKPSPTTHFSWRSNNISTYKEFSHQHLAEIGRSLAAVSSGGTAPRVNFVPVRGDFARGIFASVYFDCNMGRGGLAKAYGDFYAGAPFTHVVDRPIDLKQVVNTNKALVNIECHDGKALVTVAIDNLLKGASGQAVENMNLMAGFDRRDGLRLKASAF